MSNQTIEMQFNKLSNKMNIKLINVLRLYISLIKKILIIFYHLNLCLCESKLNLKQYFS